MFDRISFDLQVMGGRPSIKGTRILVSTIVSQIAHRASVEEVLADYPALTAKDVQQAIEYAAWLTRRRPPLVREQARLRRAKRDAVKQRGRAPKKRSKRKPDIAALFRDGRVIDEAMRRAGRAVLLEHKRRGEPIVVWQDGRVRWMSADEIQIED